MFEWYVKKNNSTVGLWLEWGWEMIYVPVSNIEFHYSCIRINNFYKIYRSHPYDDYGLDEYTVKWSELHKKTLIIPMKDVTLMIELDKTPDGVDVTEEEAQKLAIEKHKQRNSGKSVLARIFAFIK